eukprot:CAMPEP_0203773864 /NCGR_PEP_ID=MMETSP0099_2-20121227/4919_1 /ASSEMBLY_ACC=CAM_ASM_000209 /TAXON_ID=96639 /ORGANISM=" , Strain NY0313808BC1" /LENGTH=56 /DNA_ID=CAMNT_0050671791 /DNA_START=1004 /DNA_END=1171 /DNA_ORIENTATION=-
MIIACESDSLKDSSSDMHKLNITVVRRRKSEMESSDGMRRRQSDIEGVGSLLLPNM